MSLIQPESTRYNFSPRTNTVETILPSPKQQNLQQEEVIKEARVEATEEEEITFDARKGSLHAVTAGWIAGAIVLSLLINWQWSLFLFPIVFFCMGFVVIPLWLCLLWPLYKSVPQGSILWNPAICTLCGVFLPPLFLAMGNVLICWANRTPIQTDWPYLLLIPMMVTGGVTCFVGSSNRDYYRFEWWY
jgi:hypothetical protein